MSHKIYGDWHKEVLGTCMELTKGVWLWASTHLVVSDCVCWGDIGCRNALVHNPTFQHGLGGNTLCYGHTKCHARTEWWSFEFNGVATSSAFSPGPIFLFFVLVISGHQPAGTPSSNRVDLNDTNTTLRVHVEPPTRWQRIQITPPHKSH